MDDASKGHAMYKTAAGEKRGLLAQPDVIALCDAPRWKGELHSNIDMEQLTTYIPSITIP